MQICFEMSIIDVLFLKYGSKKHVYHYLFSQDNPFHHAHFLKKSVVFYPYLVEPFHN